MSRPEPGGFFYAFWSEEGLTGTFPHRLLFNIIYIMRTTKNARKGVNWQARSYPLPGLALLAGLGKSKVWAGLGVTITVEQMIKATAQ